MGNALFLKISDITIVHQSNYLIFLIEIPLITNGEYNMYHPIPLPIQYNMNILILISPEIDFLVLSNVFSH